MTDQLPEDQIIVKGKTRSVIHEHNIINSKTQCEYKNCNKKADNTVVIPLTNVKDGGVVLPFCKYHAYIVIGGQFTARKDGNLYHMSGPTKEVQLIEQVMAAREIVRKKD